MKTLRYLVFAVVLVLGSNAYAQEVSSDIPKDIATGGTTGGSAVPLSAIGAAAPEKDSSIGQAMTPLGAVPPSVVVAATEKKEADKQVDTTKPAEAPISPVTAELAKVEPTKTESTPVEPVKTEPAATVEPIKTDVTVPADKKDVVTPEAPKVEQPKSVEQTENTQAPKATEPTAADASAQTAQAQDAQLEEFLNMLSSAEKSAKEKESEKAK